MAAYEYTERTVRISGYMGDDPWQWLGPYFIDNKIYCLHLTHESDMFGDTVTRVVAMVSRDEGKTYTDITPAGYPISGAPYKGGGGPIFNNFQTGAIAYHDRKFYIFHFQEVTESTFQYTRASVQMTVLDTTSDAWTPPVRLATFLGIPSLDQASTGLKACANAAGRIALMWTTFLYEDFSFQSISVHYVDFDPATGAHSAVSTVTGAYPPTPTAFTLFADPDGVFWRITGSQNLLHVTSVPLTIAGSNGASALLTGLVGQNGRYSGNPAIYRHTGDAGFWRVAWPTMTNQNADNGYLQIWQAQLSGTVTSQVVTSFPTMSPQPHSSPERMTGSIAFLNQELRYFFAAWGGAFAPINYRIHYLSQPAGGAWSTPAIFDPGPVLDGHKGYAMYVTVIQNNYQFLYHDHTAYRTISMIKVALEPTLSATFSYLGSSSVGGFGGTGNLAVLS